MSRLDPEKNPHSEFNKQFLVTEHYGKRVHVAYHGNNENIARTTTTMAKIRLPSGKRRQGVVRRVRKLWILASAVREEK